MKNSDWLYILMVSAGLRNSTTRSGRISLTAASAMVACFDDANETFSTLLSRTHTHTDRTLYTEITSLLKCHFKNYH